LHTDEYEIALFREVDVCKGHVLKHQHLLDKMEERHGMTTAVFLERKRLNELTENPDFKEWHEGIEALRRWSETRDEYERLLGIMKISAT
jgi:two-component SAPR family response regulator